MEHKHLIGEIVCGVVYGAAAIAAAVYSQHINNFKFALITLCLFWLVGLVSMLYDAQKNIKLTVKSLGLIILGVVLFIFFN